MARSTLCSSISLYHVVALKTSAQVRRATSDPFLSLRKPPRWDLQAERFAAAVTLYQMATGAMPKWRGGSDPMLVDDEVTIESEQLDSNLREQFSDFFGGRRLPQSARAF